MLDPTPNQTMLDPDVLLKGIDMLASISAHAPFLADAAAAGNEEDAVIKIIALGGGLIIAALWIILKTVRDIEIKRSGERTKREIAAYVAEGSITPQDAAALLNAGADDEVQKITSAVAAGIVSPGKAEKLIASLRDGGKPAPN